MEEIITNTSRFVEKQEELNIEKTAANLQDMNASNLAINLNTAVNQYKQLKRLFLGLQTKLMLCDSLEDPDQLDEQTISSQLILSVNEGKEAKNQIEECKQAIEQLSNQLQAMLEAYRQKYDELKTCLQEVLKQKCEIDETERNKTTSTSAQDKNHDLVCERVTQEIVNMEQQQEAWKSELHTLRTERHQLVENVALLTRTGDKLRSKVTPDENKEDKWLSDKLSRLSAITGLREKSLTENTLVLELTDQRGSVARGTHVDLTVHFAVDDDGLWSIQSAQLGVDEDITDLVASARNNLSLLVTSVRDRWINSHRLRAEVNALRNKYALDWRNNDGMIDVLYGVCACSLHIDSSYPTPGSVTIMSVSGAQYVQPPPDDVVTLTDWLQYLETRVNHS